MKPALVYSPFYAFDWSEHIFPILKYRLLYESVLELGLLSTQEIFTPEPATYDHLLLVHTRDYLDRLRSMVECPELGWLEAEAPLNKEVYDAFLYATGGSVLASRLALERGWAMNLSGGFHHAYPDHGEGFCFINDIAVAVRTLQSEKLLRRVAVIDCDLHQGNGTAFIFRNDPDVRTFSIHEQNNYPTPKEQSDLDIGLPSGSGDDEYLDALTDSLPDFISRAEPELIIYQCGADPYWGDQLGRLRLSFEGLERRDAFIFSLASGHEIPLVALLGGGYPPETEDVVRIHLQTLRQMIAFSHD